MEGISLVNALIGLFMLVCSSGMAVAIFNAVVNRGGRRATEAQAVAAVAEAVTNLNTELRKEIYGLKMAVIELTDTIDELLPDVAECLTKEQHARLRLANNKAKLVA